MGQQALGEAREGEENRAEGVAGGKEQRKQIGEMLYEFPRR